MHYSRIPWLVRLTGVVALISLAACANRFPDTSAEVDSGIPASDSSNNELGVYGAEPAPAGRYTTSIPARAVASSRRKGEEFRYVVQRGDTLWTIAGKFLRDPWLWPEFWLRNSHIANPHLIFPGDEITLYWDGAGPALRLDRPDLRPRIRTAPLDEAVDTIPVKAIRAFLRGPRFIGKEEFETAPYIVAIEAHRLLAGEDMNVYAMRMNEDHGARYMVMHPGQVYVDPETRDVIGYEATRVAGAGVTAWTNPVTLVITDSLREVQPKDRLLPLPADEFRADFKPKRPDFDVEGKVIAAFDEVLLAGQYWIVTINRGSNHGLEAGHVLSIQKEGDRVRDPVTKNMVTLPDRRVATAMAFRVNERYSHALVLKTEEHISTGDIIRSP